MSITLVLAFLFTSLVHSIEIEKRYLGVIFIRGGHDPFLTLSWFPEIQVPIHLFKKDALGVTDAEEQTKDQINQPLPGNNRKLWLFRQLDFSNKESLMIVIQASFFATFGLYFLKNIVAWFKNGRTLELLLDSNDNDYHEYGCALTKEGIVLLSKINESMISTPFLYDLTRKVAIMLDQPCFPQKMSEYSTVINEDARKLLQLIDKYLTQNEDTLAYGGNLSTDLNNKVRKGNRSQESNFLKEGRVLYNEDLFDSIVTVQQIQMAVIFLMCRQRDAHLRLLREKLLRITNICENKLLFWKNIIKKNSLKLRLPPVFYSFLGFPSARVIGFSKDLLNRIKSSQKRNKKRKRRVVGNEVIGGSWVNPSSTSDRPKSHESKIASTATIAHGNLSGDGHGGKSPYSQLRYPGAGTSASEPLSDLKGFPSLNSVQKVILLERILAQLYELLGDVQMHLEAYCDIKAEYVSQSSREGYDEEGVGDEGRSGKYITRRYAPKYSFDELGERVVRPDEVGDVGRETPSYASFVGTTLFEPPTPRTASARGGPPTVPPINIDSQLHPSPDYDGRGGTMPKSIGTHTGEAEPNGNSSTARDTSGGTLVDAEMVTWNRLRTWLDQSEVISHRCLRVLCPVSNEPSAAPTRVPVTSPTPAPSPSCRSNPNSSVISSASGDQHLTRGTMEVCGRAKGLHIAQVEAPACSHTGDGKQ